MSEFRIIKCKSCDASLVELQGENIKKCVQCGYDFNRKVNKKPKLESVVELAFENQTNHYNPPTQKQQSLSETLSETTSQTNSQSSPQTTTQSKGQGTKRKNPSSIIGTIIKWYIILFIGSRVLQEIF